MLLKSEKALSLLEIMVASLVLTTAIIGIIALFNNTYVLNEFNRDRTLATTHGLYVLEEIKNTGFTGLEANINNGVWDRTSGQLAGAPYNLTVLTNESIDTSVISSGDPLRIAVTVNWQDRNQNARSLTLQTLKTNGS